MQTMMGELLPPGGQGGPPTQQALSAYQSQMDGKSDLTSTLMDMLGETDDEDENQDSSVNTNA